jgi:tRNA(Ile2) C34 agmatinyltransferase TiaS
MNTALGSNEHILAGAQNPVIYGGTFANVAGNLTINTTERPGKPVITVMRTPLSSTVLYRAQAPIGQHRSRRFSRRR